MLLKGIGRHQRTTLQQLLALAGRHLAHGGEGIGSMGRSLLERVLGLHVELASHLIAKVARHIVIQGLAVAADAAPDARGMGGEYRGHLGQIGLDMKQTHARGPLVEVGNHLQSGVILPLDDALDDEGCRIGEHARLVIVAVGMKRVHAIAVPHLGIELVLVRIQGVIGHQHRNGLAGDVPVPYPHLHATGQARLALPCGKRRLALDKRGRGVIGRPDVGADEYQIVFISFLEGLGLCR